MFFLVALVARMVACAFFMVALSVVRFEGVMRFGWGEIGRSWRLVLVLLWLFFLVKVTFMFAVFSCCGLVKDGVDVVGMVWVVVSCLLDFFNGGLCWCL